MTGSELALATLSAGARLAVQYNPVAAAVSVAIAAAIAGSPSTRGARWKPAALTILMGWLVGDGVHVVGLLRDLAAEYAGRPSFDASSWAGLGVASIWALGSLALGYVAPTLLGVAVGRRVTHGTGRLAAAAIACSATLILAVIVAGLS